MEAVTTILTGVRTLDHLKYTCLEGWVIYTTQLGLKSAIWNQANDRFHFFTVAKLHVDVLISSNFYKMWDVLIAQHVIIMMYFSIEFYLGEAK